MFLRLFPQSSIVLKRAGVSVYMLHASCSDSLALFDHLSVAFVVCVGFTLSQLGSGHAAGYHVREKTSGER